MSYKFAYVIFLFCSNVGPPYLLYNINRVPPKIRSHIAEYILSIADIF